MKTHKDLDVCKKSIVLVTSIYEFIKAFPNDELFCLVNQIGRCAVSIPSNIAEGARSDSSKEFDWFLFLSLGSLEELERQLIISQNLKYIADAEIEKIIDELIVIRKLTVGFKKSLKFQDT